MDASTKTTKGLRMTLTMEAKYLAEIYNLWNRLDMETVYREEMREMLTNAMFVLVQVLNGEYTQSDIEQIIPETIDSINKFLKGER